MHTVSKILEYVSWTYHVQIVKSNSSFYIIGLYVKTDWLFFLQFVIVARCPA